MASAILIAERAHYGINGRLPYTLPIDLAPGRVIFKRGVILKTGHFGINGRLPYTLPFTFHPNEVTFRTSRIVMEKGHFHINGGLPYTLPFAFTQNEVFFHRGERVIADQGTYAISGSIKLHRRIIITPEPYNIATLDADIEKDIRLVCSPGIFSEVGINVKICRSIRGTLTYAITGIDVAFDETSKVNCIAGVYAMTNPPVTFRRKTPLASGSFSMTGLNCTLRRGLRVFLSMITFGDPLPGNTIDSDLITIDSDIPIDSGTSSSNTIDSEEITIDSDMPIDSDIGSSAYYIIQGLPAQLVRDGVIAANAGTFDFLGGDALFHRVVPCQPYAMGYVGLPMNAFRSFPLEGGTFSIAEIITKIHRSIKLEPGVFQVTEEITTVRYQIVMEPGAFTHTGNDATITEDFTIVMEHGFYSLTGKVMKVHRKIPMLSGTFDYNNLDANIGEGRKFEPGSYSLTGSPIKIHQKKKLDATSYVLTGNPVRTNRSRVFIPGTFTVTGLAMLLKYGIKVALAKGNFTLIGLIGAELFKKVAKTDPGTFSVTPNVLRIHHKKKATAGAFNLTGAAMGAKKLWTLVAQAGSFILTGLPVKILPRFDKGIYTITGLPIRVSRNIPLEIGTFAITGLDATFTWSKTHTGHKLTLKEPYKRKLTLKPANGSSSSTTIDSTDITIDSDITIDASAASIDSLGLKVTIKEPTKRKLSLKYKNPLDQ